MVISSLFFLSTTLMTCSPQVMCSISEPIDSPIFQPGILEPLDSKTHLQVGQKAPDFILPGLSGKEVSLSDLTKDNVVVITFVPAAWTPVCSEQWPGYNVAEPFFKDFNATMIGITVDNLPTLYAWTKEMGGLWFEVASDFYPHGKVTGNYGILRSDGTSERALFVIDRQGIIRYIDVHDINKRPPLDELIEVLNALNK